MHPLGNRCERWQVVSLSDTQDFAMNCRNEFFICRHKHLVKTFSWTQACVDDRNIPSQAQAVQAGHFLCQVHNPHRASHIQKIESSLIRYSSSKDNKPTGFGNSHKIACGLGVCDSNRSSLLDLLSKHRDDTAPAADHVPEAHGA